MKRTAAVVLLMLALLVGEAGAGDLVPAATMGDRRAQLQRLLTKLTQSRQQLHEVRRRERRVLSDIEDIDRSRDEAERRLRDLAIELVKSRTAAQATATRMAITERRLTLHRTRVRARLRDIYKYGRTGYVDVLLGAGDVGEFVTRWQFITTIVRADGTLIADYAADLQEYRALQEALHLEQTRLAEASRQAQARRREMGEREQAKRAALARLQKERATFEEMVRELEEDSRQIEVLIRRAQGSALRSVALARGLAGFIWPARGLFTSGFGMRRHPIFGIRRMHTGQDIAAAYGSPVLAASDGWVIYAGWFGGYGKIVIIDHGGGVSTLYAHLSRILTREGAEVRRGQVIGRVGSTGYSTGPHVHFEVRINGRPIDPARR